MVSQGVGIHGADAWYNAGYRGNSVKVGVIDSGFEGFRLLQGSELSGNFTARCYFEEARAPSSSVADCEADGDQGTAIAETVLDVAPDVELFIANPVTNGDLRNAADWMAGQGVEVINYSLGDVYDGPGDGTSPFGNSPLKTVDAAVSNGITWVTAAGNDARNVWYGAFSDPDSDGRHNFAPGVQANNFTAREGDRAVIFMRWDDSWGRADCDLDLEIYRASRGLTNLVGLACPMAYRMVVQGSFLLKACLLMRSLLPWQGDL